MKLRAQKRNGLRSNKKSSGQKVGGEGGGGMASFPA